MELLNTICHASRNRKERQEMSRKIGKSALYKGSPTTLGQIHPLPASQLLSIFPTPLSQIDLALKEAPKVRPRYFRGNEETTQPKMPAKPSTLSKQPTGIKTDLAKLIFKPEAASKHKNNTRS
jgi:hypothetical protein